MEMTFLPEETERSFNVTVIPDEVLENVERFDVVLRLVDDTGRFKVLDRLSVIVIDSSSST